MRAKAQAPVSAHIGATYGIVVLTDEPLHEYICTNRTIVDADSQTLEAGKFDRRDLAKEILVKLNLKAGDTIYLTDTADGMRITPSDPDFERQMKLAGRVAKKRRSALRALAR